MGYHNRQRKILMNEGETQVPKRWRPMHSCRNSSSKCSSCSTVELVKLVSRRFTEFLQRIFYVQIGAVANFLGGHIGSLVRFNNVFDRLHCGLNNLLRGV